MKRNREVAGMSNGGTISIVCPAYQEEEVLPRFHAALTAALEPLADEYDLEILYVDDGSPDDTLETIRRLPGGRFRLRYLSLSRNFGHQAALTAGLEHATGDAVVSLDTDLQHPPSLIPQLVERWREGYDVVLTIRADDRRLGLFKRLTSRAFYKLLGRCSRLDVRPAASDFRLLGRPAVDALVKLRENHRYVRGMVQWLGFRTAEVPFTPDARVAGKSKYTIRKMVRFALDGLLSFSPVPVRAVVAGGLGLTALSWIVCVGITLAALPIGKGTTALALVGWTALHLLTACVLAALGMLGEYAVRIYDQSKGRPVYVVKESSDEAIAARTATPIDIHRAA